MRAMTLAHKTRAEFRRLPRREQIRWLVFAERQFVEQHPETIPSG